MLMSVASVEKPVSRVSLVDWVGKVHDIRNTCDSRRGDAFNLRNESRQLRNETNSKTKWNNYHNNVRLQDRITEVTRWRDQILDCESDVKKEISDLMHEKDLTEAEIEYLNLSFTVVSECLTQRDKRGGSDLCRDPAEEELKRELALLESLKKMLTDKCQAAWEQRNRLEELKFQLEQDINDKTETLNIDHFNLGLDENCANTSYKPYPLRVPKQTLSYDSWLEHCKFLKQRAEHELATSQKLRESMFVPRERARNDLQAQNDATSFALRKRIYDTQRIKNELEWQRINMVSDMERLVVEMANLETAFLKKTNALKLTETRCENRLYRPGSELCQDEPMTGLANQVNQLRNTQNQLQEKLDAARETANALEEQLLVVDRELANKNQALSTDLQCLDLRDRLVTGTRAPPPTQTDRNIVLTRIQNEIPDE